MSASTVAITVPAYAARPDWFVLTPDQAQAVGLTPGISFDEKRGQWICHRTVLPLLGARLSDQDRTVDSVTNPFTVGTTLRPHQATGIDYIRARRGTLLADAPRVGKTAQIVAAHDPDDGPLVVVGPLAVKKVWLDWFTKRWPDVNPVVLDGRSYDPDRARDAKLIFAHYDIIAGWASVGLHKIGTLVLDEAHKLAHRKSRRTQAALIMSPQASRIVCATGTPLWNKPEGLWPILAITNPGAWGPYYDFTARFASGHPGPRGWETGKPSNVDEFKARLGECMLRRVWRDLVDDLIPTIREIVRVAIDADLLRTLDMLAESLRDGSQNDATLIGQMARYRRLVGKIKAEPAATAALQRVRAGEPVVVWVWHHDVGRDVAIALANLVPTWQVNGSTPEHDREDLLDQWRQSEAPGVLIMSLGVGQAGIDLSHARHCIFAELDWTPAVIGQAEMRTFSPMRGDDVTYIVAEHEVDERLVNVLAEKCEQALLLGTPAADTAIDVLARVRSDAPIESDLSGLAARMAARVRESGATFEGGL